MEENEQIFRKLQQFSKINEQFAITFKLLRSKKRSNRTVEVNQLLDYIAKEIIIVPQYFEAVLENLPREIPRLLKQATSFTDNFPFSQPRHIVNCILLSKLVKERPDLKSYVLKYFEKHPAPFEEDANDQHKPKRSRIALSDNIFVRDIDVVEACYFLLQSDPKFFRKKWKWSVFIRKYSMHTEYEVAWLSCHITAIVLGLNEPSLNALIAQKIPTDINLKLTMQFDKNKGFQNASQNPHPLDQQPIIPPAQFTDVADIVNVSGIYIPALEGPKIKTLIEVPSTYQNLRKIAIGLSSGKALCLQGPVGSGKTGLVEHLAGCTGRQLGESFVKVQLGDQTDSKMLLGTYRCTDIPGEFIWQAGVLTQAVLDGSWLLLEDIDLASMDIASVLASLLENNALSVPGYRDMVPITPGFQLIVTQRLVNTISGHHKRHTSSMHLLEKQLLQVTIDPLTSEELKHILHVKYPQFDTISERLISVFELFSKNEELSFKKSGRLVSTRDFFKWCSRASENFDVKSQESALKVLQDAIDVFCCAIADPAEGLALAKEISTHLGIINQKAEYFLKNYKPDLRLTHKSLIAGRASLKREHTVHSKTAKYCFTRPAAVLLERVMCCVKLHEPVLLVGETGTGKTSSVQYLAHTLGKKLIVINMNQQSDSADLLGGFKPVDMKIVMSQLRGDFEDVFRDYFNVEANKEFLNKLAFAFNKQKYVQLVSMMHKSTSAALRRLAGFMEEEPTNENKRVKHQTFLERWQVVGEKLKKVEVQLKQNGALFFAFIEGSLVKAVQEGSWVLLDEINLAGAETLECLSGLLEGTAGSLCLLERGDKKPVKRHPGFTLFACMNPATNVGKKDLPVGLRNRFTEFYVDELTEKNDLVLLVGSYLEAMALKDGEITTIVDFYLHIRKEMQKALCDGLGHKPHFSLRSLCRALMIASKNPCGTFRRSLYEAFCLSFLTQLDSTSYENVQGLISSYLVGEKTKLTQVLNQPIPEPIEKGNKFLEFEGYWIKQGDLEPKTPEDYVLTPSVRKNLKDLARVVSIGKLPVLLQGDTSVGKTSLITYLAKSSGNKCVRINNHEHTDLQEYIGSYVADSTGKLVFREGVLVEAMRKGFWIILDELNLAPTDVLEALNRVLDDNRELYIPETQETVKADPNFMLFATQNPPGAYGGRKMLSRAFRNRFVELHFNEIPPKELEFILHKRCEVAASYAKKMIMVMSDLQIRRRGSAAFAGKQGFITLRDLFRWGERYRLAQNQPAKLYDWNQHMADEGYLVLAGKVRKDDEKKEIVEVLQKHWKVDVKLENLFSLHNNTSIVTKHILQKLENNSSKYPNIVWTFNMRKLAVLTAKALEFKEPVLLVGETGGGKTTICQLIADMNGQELNIVNCHMHTESSDFIGGLRPVRDHSENTKLLFEWVDGPLLLAMSKGNVFLADEISLADDSVLERLNSLLEPERTLLLAEKAIDLNNLNNSETITADEKFVFIGTMNPGGDFGKKELSPALRNRFTEIWCESCTDREDLILIINKNICEEGREAQLGDKMMDFIEWFKKSEIGKRYTVSIRDILTWVNFINVTSKKINISEAYIHGAYLVFLDSLGSGVTSTESHRTLKALKQECQTFVTSQSNYRTIESTLEKIICTNNTVGIVPFFIAEGQEIPLEDNFSFEAPTTIKNTLNLLRGMQLNKAILLEGSPGVGKTSLVTALAKLARHKIFRVNLSDQTDISDLFGADLPVEGGTGGQFSWRDGPLLQALKEGCWILLDELNLASQSVLEGLNACLDHRGEIFIPELGRTFHVQLGTRFFACQNPMKQGGSRRGLPKSFLNRFIQVYVSPFSPEDMEVILSRQFPTLPDEMIRKMITFNYRLSDGLEGHVFGNKGAPWECNLRDLTRWCEATLYLFKNSPNSQLSPENTVQLIYIDRMRTITDKTKIKDIFEETFGCQLKGTNPVGYINKNQVYFGDACVQRAQDEPNEHVLKEDENYLILRRQMGAMRSLAYCVNQNWMAILVGSSGVGKSAAVKTLANLAGKTLRTLPVTSAMDTTDILGGFEQTNYSRHLEEIAKEAEKQTLATVQGLLTEEKVNKAAQLLEHWEEYLDISGLSTETMEEEVELFLRRISKLEGLLKELYMKCSLANEAGNLLQLLDKCTNISKAVGNDKSLNAGGRFEWVNSVLVKCLQEGSWLLVDNVNLCSAAVLDRLNGLLEPNGVLTISERGVDENGKMFEVKPHKDFRIFLTMDPKNGEISRAMRNRGVEIYMLNEQELPTPNSFDLKSLVHLEGLTNPQYIRALIKIHEFISSLIQSEKPSQIDILQCSNLISQQINHGLDVFEAFFNTCMEVYYKTRSLSEFNCNNVVEIIKDAIERSLKEQLGDNFKQNVTLGTKHLIRWSDLEKTKHHAVAFETALISFNQNVSVPSKNLQMPEFLKRLSQSNKSRSAKDITIWSDLEHVKRYNDFFDSVGFYNVANLLLFNFSLSSADDVDYKINYLKSISNSEWQAAIERFEKVAKVFGRSSPQMPFDCRWINRDENKSSGDAINLALQFEIYKLRDRFEIKRSANNSLYMYVLALKNHEVSNHMNSQILNSYTNLRVAHFVFMKQVLLASAEKNTSPHTFVKTLEILSWRQALHTFLTSVNLPDVAIKSPKLFESKLDSLALYYKWFLKNSVMCFAGMFDAKIPEELQAILTTLNESLEQKSPKNLKIASNFKKLNNVPSFLSYDWQLESLQLLQSYDFYDLRNDFKRAVSFIKNHPEYKSLLVKLKSYIYSNNSELSGELTGLKPLTNDDTEKLLEVHQSQLLPLINTVAQALLLRTMEDVICEKNVNLEGLESNLLMPIELVGALNRFKETSDLKLTHEIKHLFYSAALNSSKFIEEDKTALVPGLSSAITELVTHLLVNLDGETTTLKNFRDVQSQQRFLAAFLWDNMYNLSNEKFDFISIQTNILKKSLNSLTDKLKKVLGLGTLENLNHDQIKDKTLKFIIFQIKQPYVELIHDQVDTLSYIADLHMIIAFSEMFINSSLPQVDPLAKKTMKRNHIESVIRMFEQMKTSFELQNQLLSNEVCIHPYYNALREIIQELQGKVRKYGENSNVGVKSYSYSFVVQQIQHATSNIIQPTILEEIATCTNLIQTFKEHKTKKQSTMANQKIKSHIDSLEARVPTYENIIQDWKQYRGSYPDIFEPLLANLCQFLYGFKMKIWWLKREITRKNIDVKLDMDLEQQIVNLVALPEYGEFNYENAWTFTRYVLSNDEAYIREREQVRLLKCTILDCYNNCIIASKISGKIDIHSLKDFSRLVDLFVIRWNLEQENKEKQQKEAESLYKIKTKCDDKTEDQQIQEELQELFPNHHVLDFSDLEEKSLSDPTPEEPKITNCPQVITNDDLKYVTELHSKMFKNFIKTEWLASRTDNSIQADFVTPLMERHCIARKIMDKYPKQLHYGVDQKMFGSLAVLIEVNRRYGMANDLVDGPSPTKITNTKTRDFYKEPDIEEVKSCRHVLDILKSRVEEVLLEWPDQPTLTTILTVIDRILNFDLKSPVSRFLTGLDVLLAKCHEWEQVAHSGISLLKIVPELIEQIITWRKLELSRWKDLLNCTFNDMTKPLSKWWLYMYNLSTQYITQKQVSEADLVNLLQAFITKSPLAEFPGRLNLILEFHLKAVALPRTAETESFINILWNVYNYFNQFSMTIANKMKDLRSPIEKKLKDYVKIVKWKDVSYWSVKDTVDKSHKILHKFVREYKEALSQPVTQFLTNPPSESATESVGIWDRPQRQNPKAYHYTLDADCYIVKPGSKDHHYLAKARKICKDTILGTKYPKLVKSLDGFVTEVIETSGHLRNLEVDTTLTKEKQVSQAKNILHQKHRALADLFQSLSKMGVSYKTGILDSKLKKPTEEFSIKPVDLGANFSYLVPNRTDEKMLTIWDCCELYYYRCLLRYDVLETALITPAPDLGMQNVERCKGFSAHLLTLCQQQKKSLVSATRLHYYLRIYAKKLRETCETPTYLKIDTLLNIKNTIALLSSQIIQVKLFLNSCPEECSFDDTIMEVPLLESSGSKVRRKEDDQWRQATKHVNHIDALIGKISQYIKKCEENQPLTDREELLKFLKFLPFSNVQLLLENLQGIMEDLKLLMTIFAPLQITQSLASLQNSIAAIIDQTNVIVSEEPAPIDHAELLESFTKSLLLAFQNLYKKYQEHQKDDEKDIDLQDKHLKELITRNLSSDIAALDLPTILQKAEALITNLLGQTCYASENARASITNCLPLLEQILLLSQYFITQQVAAYRTTCKLTSILNNIFIDLATKGFCVPPELSEDMDKEGLSKPSDGLGLGEGQGEKDVSDKIESEDQLDDAQPAGQEKEDKEDPDCKEEDKGIEMSEDFDSKLQDKKPSGEEDDEQSDNSDAEEQMGETEQGADQLDQEIWGDEDDKNQEDEEGDEEKNEEGTGGEKDGEDQLGAKDDNKSKEKSKNKDPSEGQDEESEKNKKEINEMNEPEFDDEQTDPYHGNQPELPEPEPMDLPDDLQLDEGEEKDGEQPEENPFDIDEMKDQQVPEDKPENDPSQEQNEQKNDDETLFSSDDEDVTKNDDTDRIEDDGAKPKEEDKPEGAEDVPETKENEEGIDEAADNDDDNSGEALDENPTNQENVEAMEVDEASATDKTQATQSENLKSDKPIEETCQEDKPDKEGMGQSQMEQNESGHSVQSNQQQEAKSSNMEQETEEKKKEKPGQSDMKRSLGDVNQPVEKKLKTSEARTDVDDGQDPAEEQQSDMYQHIQEAKQEKSKQILDAATKEQAEEQKKEACHQEAGEENEEQDVDGAKDISEETDDKMDVDIVDEQGEKPLKSETSKEKRKNKKQHPEGDIMEDLKDIDIEGDIIQTSTVPRGAESSHHTHYHLLQETKAANLTQEEINQVRAQVEQELSSWKSAPNSIEAEQTWQKISSVTQSLAQDLSEQLRLVLEPTQASHLKGDFRTGKRINMRKVIPYIASQFRKDKIWLRRTKPSKREYQIVLAIDDSSSMADNHSKELAFESIALVSKALSLLESGQLGIVSFGENTEVHHRLSEPFDDKSGVKLLQNFQFGQQKTNIGALLNFVTEMFEQNPVQSSIPNAKLLLIVSDGRGIFSEGKAYVTEAVRRAKLANIFVVFVVIDSPNSKHSILDVRSAVFENGKLLGMKTYLDEFPFSFYLILRDINSLPSVLSDALMQWFEMVTSQQ
ncbi:midasin [Anthonomus grandis grandis]|uniref:midasin n=1 Tax=Anthonomus grandis grandis TaxID=2921223 RepID=UPI0021666694|nr:midasin [Anthonomus grandis grandis]